MLDKGQKNQGFWKGIGIQNFTSLSSYSFNRIGIIPYPWFLWKERNIWIWQNTTEFFNLPEFWRNMQKNEWKSSILVNFLNILNLENEKFPFSKTQGLKTLQFISRQAISNFSYKTVLKIGKINNLSLNSIFC